MHKILLIFFSFLVIVGCKKKDDVTPPVYPMSAQIIDNGSNYYWNASTATAQLIIDTAVSFRYVRISATATGKLITIEFTDKSTGNSIGTSGHDLSDAYFQFVSSAYHTTSGNVTVTANNASTSKFSGTFDFTVLDANGKKTVIEHGQIKDVSYSVVYQ